MLVKQAGFLQILQLSPFMFSLQIIRTLQVIEINKAMTICVNVIIVKRTLLSNTDNSVERNTSFNDSALINHLYNTLHTKTLQQVM